ncbi:MAG: hypothetical protein AB1592_18920 [Pseudomonadota bacterium]
MNEKQSKLDKARGAVEGLKASPLWAGVPALEAIIDLIEEVRAEKPAAPAVKGRR